MLTRRRDTARRVVMWAAGVVLLLSIACLRPGPRFLGWWAPKNGSCWVGLGCGCVWIGRPDMTHLFDQPLPGLPGIPSELIPWHRRVDWRPRLLGDSDAWAVQIPLWIPAGSAAGVMFGALLVGRRGRAFVRSGHCPTCGYDLIGIDGVCPECGSGQPGRGVTPAKGTDDV